MGKPSVKIKKFLFVLFHRKSLWSLVPACVNLYASGILHHWTKCPNVKGKGSSLSTVLVSIGAICDLCLVPRRLHILCILLMFVGRQPVSLLAFVVQILWWWSLVYWS